MNNILKPAIILSIVAFFSAFILSHVKGITYPVILQQEIEKQQNALNMVLPGYTTGDRQSLTLDDGSKFFYWIGEKKVNDVIKNGYAFISVKYGYSGNIKAMVGLDEENRILGISIIQQSETPGLGARVTERVSKDTFWDIIFGRSVSSDEIIEPWFQEQFKGINLNQKIAIVKKGIWTMDMRDELMQSNGICAITGATITTKAVTGSLREGLLNLNKIKDIQSQKEATK